MDRLGLRARRPALAVVGSHRGQRGVVRRGDGTAAALDVALAGKADASALAALLSTVDGVDTPLEVDTKWPPLLKTSIPGHY